MCLELAHTFHLIAASCAKCHVSYHIDLKTIGNPSLRSCRIMVRTSVSASLVCSCSSELLLSPAANTSPFQFHLGISSVCWTVMSGDTDFCKANKLPCGMSHGTVHVYSHINVFTFKSVCACSLPGSALKSGQSDNVKTNKTWGPLSTAEQVLKALKMDNANSRWVNHVEG